jgi:aspartyl aminopeptidase
VAIKEKTGVAMRIVDLRRPILRIPNLAIHLNRDVNKEGLKLNPQTHLVPIWGLSGDKGTRDGDDVDYLRTVLAEELKVSREAILDHDLSLYDTQKGTLAGLEDEFIQTARLDNLASCHSALDALMTTRDQAGRMTRLIALYDHEEVGSHSAQGAAGPFLETVLSRIVDAQAKPEPQGYARAIASSFHISADMAHAVHPNYADRHEPQHMPVLGQGPVVKANAGQSYATDGESAARFIALCKEAGVSTQNFVVRTDLACGSTIGPITATRIGVKTVDVGNPMLSMHSIREMGGTADVEQMHRALVHYFRSA